MTVNRPILIVSICLVWILTYASAFCQSQDAFGVVSVVPAVPSVMIDDSTYAAGGPLRLSAGTHKIVVLNPDRIHFQKRDFVKTFELKGGEHVEIRVEFENVSEVNSYPMNSAVFSGGIPLGFTPLQLPLAEYRDKSLQIRKEGYRDLNMTVDDSVIRKGFLYGTLTPNGISVANNENEFVNLSWKEQGPSKHKVPLIVNGLGAIAAGTLAAVYKNMADNRFEKAKLARRDGNTDLQHRLVKQTHRYDRYAAIGFVAMQVNVIALIYFLEKSK